MDSLVEPPSVQLFQIVISLLLVFVNGFFVASEISIVKTRTSQLETLILNSYWQKSIAKKALYFSQHINSFLAAVQVGITLASLALGWVGEIVFNKLIRQFLVYLELNLSSTLVSSLSIAGAFLLITSLHIVLGEMVPKIVALNRPVRMIFFVTLPMWLFYWTFRPFVWILDEVSNFFLRLWGVKLNTLRSSLYSEEEIKLIISDSHEAGQIGETELELIENIFEFDECEVADVYTSKKDIKSINIDYMLYPALKYALEHAHSRYPVYADSPDNIVGVVTTKDLMKLYLTTKNKELKIKKLLRKPLFISETSKIYQLLKRMQSEHVQLALVTDEIGEVVGIVTFEDIAAELVGFVEDKFLTPIVEAKKGAFVVQAHNSIVQINKQLPHKLAEEEQYSTLSGYINYLYPDIEFKPRDVIKIERYKGTILKMHRNTVEVIKLELATLGAANAVDKNN